MKSTFPFSSRHIGLTQEAEKRVLAALDLDGSKMFLDKVLPDTIRLQKELELPEPLSEHDALLRLRQIAAKNQVLRSYIGMGYHGTVTPPVIRRQILENPNWYTAYTPYQAEIAQGRLEALLNFQTMVSDLTALDVANASLLDEATAGAEAMMLAYRIRGHESRNRILVAAGCHPQTVDVVRTRAEPLEIEVVVSSPDTLPIDDSFFAFLFQYPESDGRVFDPRPSIEIAKKHSLLTICATDLLALTLLVPPGEMGVDIAIGSSQRFGVPIGFGGPHAAFMATKEEYVRQIPGRVVGVSRDRFGERGLRLALQTREQHIRRERATSNICTAQVLLAVVAAMYAVYHGPEGLRSIAERIHRATRRLRGALRTLGFSVAHESFFDTLRVVLTTDQRESVLRRAKEKQINLRRHDDGSLGIALDETVQESDLVDLVTLFASGNARPALREAGTEWEVPEALRRHSSFLSEPVFRRYRSETELLRYLHRLESKDLTLTTSMIPLGSCTMKLNAAAEMEPISWPEFSVLHPFVPREQAEGYIEIFRDLESALGEITGFDAVSLQPNAGSQGEYAGLLAIRRYHLSRGDGNRRICLIPESAHGTNPATAAMAGMHVVSVRCDPEGNVDLEDLETKASEHRTALAALMITYPSTHGVFEERIREIAEIVHRSGGQVYMDGANLNAQVAVARPADFGMDLCHLNLHKTFCIPHGGGGPGMGPIGVRKHLAPFLPGHFFFGRSTGAVAAAPWGSPSILLIPWMYLRMMGADGLRGATVAAMLNANYVARRLDPHYPVLYRGNHGFVAHECIIDLRSLQKSAGIEVVDVAKRLVDYGFHAPTVSFPVAGTMMIEPTESESLEELDRFCDAMIAVREEIREIETGRADRNDNLLKNAPHTARELTSDTWTHPYSRQRAAYPLPYLLEHKYWSPVARIDSAYGDRHLVCSCS